MHKLRQTGLRLLILVLISGLGVLLPVIAASTVHAPSTERVKPLPKVRIAVLAYRGTERAKQRWGATIDYLNQQIPDYRFDAIPMNLAELDQAVVEGSVDFAITNAGQHVRVGSKYGMSWLATLKSRQHQGRGPVIGSALVVRSDSSYRSLDDLRHAHIGAVSPLAFGGAQIYWGELASKGLRPESFFAQTKFSGYPVDALAFWVRDELVDAAVVPACLLETLDQEGLITLSDFRVIDPISHSGFNCQTSSQLYPNWSFSKLKATPAELAGKVVRALLIMPADSTPARDAGSLGWTAPVSSFDIHQLYQRLNIHPWQEPWWQELRRWVLQNWQWSLALVLGVLVGFGHHLWVQLTMQRRTLQLLQANDELRDRQQQLEHAQRVAILGELSSNLAHELNQPLTAINSFSEGGIVRLKTAATPPDLTDLLSRIRAEAQRGAQIIHRIRSFARKEPAQRIRTDLVALIQETLQLLDYELKKLPLTLELSLPSAPLQMAVDPVEIQQLLVNLIRNGIEAMENSPLPHRLIISCQQTSDGGGLISIQDSGKGTSGASVEELFKPFYSTKPQGLGLGMSICRRIAEAHDGSIEMQSVTTGGTRVICSLGGKTHE